MPFDDSSALTKAIWEHFPYRVVPDHANRDHKKMTAWCEQQLGFGAVAMSTPAGTNKPDHVWVDTTAHWALRYRVYCFKDPARAIEFKLVWG